MNPIATGETFNLIVPATVTAVVTPEEVGGYSATVFALPGCHTEGDSLEELQANLAEVVALWLREEHRHQLGPVHPDAGLSRRRPAQKRA